MRIAAARAPMDQHLAEVDVAALADAQQLHLAARVVLPRNKPEPCCEVSPLAERSAVPNGSNDGCSEDGADARDLRMWQQPASLSAICSSLSVSSSICWTHRFQLSTFTGTSLVTQFSANF